MRRPVVPIYHHTQYRAPELVEAKRGRTVSVCLPARDEEATVGAITTVLRRDLVEAIPLVDEIVVVDDHSTDRTAAVAAEAGARVVAAADILGGHADGPGKGQALWTSLHESDGDLVAWCDADLVGFGAHFVVGLLGPLLTRPDVGFVKGCYDRAGGDGDRGGRVTELVARPVLSVLFPHLASIVQPLAGEYAGRRDLLEQLPFVAGYGVDLGLLVDVAARFGTGVIAQVDLGWRMHRHRPIDELSPQATAILQAALRRAGSPLARAPAVLARPGLDPVVVDTTELPPLVEVPGYRRRSA